MQSYTNIKVQHFHIEDSLILNIFDIQGGGLQLKAAVFLDTDYSVRISMHLKFNAQDLNSALSGRGDTTKLADRGRVEGEWLVGGAS